MLRTLLFATFALSSPAIAAPAADAITELRAQELPAINETGITAFDSVFMQAKEIHDTLDAVQQRIFDAEDRVAGAIGLPSGTPIRLSMWELKQIAGGPLNVEMKGGKPYLTVGGSGGRTRPRPSSRPPTRRSAIWPRSRTIWRSCRRRSRSSWPPARASRASSTRTCSRKRA